MLPRRPMVALLLCLASLGPPVLAGEASRRIVSLNLCTDQIVLDLVPRERIAGVSFVAADPNVSPVAHEIRGLTLVHGIAEEVLALDPDLVIAGTFTTTATVDLLRRLGRRVEIVPLAQDFDGIRRSVRQIAAAVGEAERGERVIAEFDARLARAPAPPARPVSALAYQINGLVAGTATLVDQIFTAAGLSNRAAEHRLGPGGRLALESLLADPPDLVVVAQPPDTYRTPVADNLRHPALTALLRERPGIVLPMPVWLCGTPRIADAVARLAEARVRVAATMAR
jgi:iron complex transport system substrate-binding protein